MPYSFFGEMMFKSLTDDTNAIILELEKILVNEPPVNEDTVWQEIIMFFLLQIFGNTRKCSRTQAEVIDYLCKRWNISKKRYEELKIKCATDEEIEAMLDKLAKNLGMDEGGPNRATKQE